MTVTSPPVRAVDVHGWRSRRLGLGRALLQVETDNVTAARLYEGLGFHAVQRCAYRQHRPHRQHRQRRPHPPR
jgi:RimJ/RimL family protein N-acetyltransferase